MAMAYLAVRAEVPEADRVQFDHWYETDHLPWALRVFKARRAWRMTSTKFLRITLGLPRPTANSASHLFVLTYNIIAAVQDRAGCRDQAPIHFSTKCCNWRAAGMCPKRGF